MGNSAFTYCPQCTEKLQEQNIDGEVVEICPSCGFQYWKKPKPAVSILIHKKDSVLLLQRSSDPFKCFWVLPGGFIRYDETPREAVMRETKEEISLIPALGKIIGAYRIDDDPRGVHIDIIYEGTMSGTIRLSHEHSAYTFFPCNMLPEHIAYKHREAIRDWKKI